jgi:hypothetical protein
MLIHFRTAAVRPRRYAGFILAVQNTPRMFGNERNLLRIENGPGEMANPSL